MKIIEKEKEKKDILKLIMEFERTLLLLLTWTLTVETIQRREVIEGMSITNMILNTSSDCYTLFLQTHEKTIRSVR
jgi:hypothetical protein